MTLRDEAKSHRRVWEKPFTETLFGLCALAGDFDLERKKGK